MVYLLESSSLHAIPSICGNEADSGRALTKLGRLVEEKQLCFCRQSLVQLKALAGDNSCTAWASATIRGMWCNDVDWMQTQEVVVQLEELTDFELLEEEVELPIVIALAIDHKNRGNEVTVVTEDSVSKPDMPSMLETCQYFEIPVITLGEFATQVDLLAAD